MQALSLARTLEDITQIVAGAARQLMDADGATFVLRDQNLCHYADEDAIAPLWKGRRFPMETCISGWVMLNRETAILEDIYADSRIPADAYRPTFVKSLAMVPIRRVAPIGAIGAYWASRYQATPEEVALLQALADTTSVALENVQVYQELEKTALSRSAEPVVAHPDSPLTADAAVRPEELVRMCAWTKRLELDGQWLSIESYLQQRFDLKISHGISKEAAREMLKLPAQPRVTAQE